MTRLIDGPAYSANDVYQEPHCDPDTRYERLHAQWEILKCEYAALLLENQSLQEKVSRLSYDLKERSRAVRKSSLEAAKQSKTLCERSAELTEAAAEFAEQRGVFWRVRQGQAAEPIAYCPSCCLPLVPFPKESSKLLTCETCGFVPRGLSPREVPRIASQIRLTA